MNAIQKWLVAVRLPFFTGIAMPIIIGAAVAYYDTSQFNWLFFFISLFGGIFAHAAANLANDYYDHRTTDDDINVNFTPFSGGSRAIQERLISPKGMLIGAFAFWGLALACGIYLTIVTPGYWILLLAAAGFIGGFFYTAGRYAFAYHGFGELMILINFGILPVLGAYFVQTGHFSWMAFWAAFPIGFLITAILYINQYPDYEADKSVKKNHLVAQLGKKKARIGYYFLIFGAYLGLILAVIFTDLTPYALLALLSLPVAFKTASLFAKNFEKIKELIPAQAGTIKVHSLLGLLMAIGIVIGTIV